MLFVRLDGSDMTKITDGSGVRGMQLPVHGVSDRLLRLPKLFPSREPMHLPRLSPRHQPTARISAVDQEHHRIIIPTVRVHLRRQRLLLGIR